MTTITHDASSQVVTYACAPAPYPPPLQKNDGARRSNDDNIGNFVMPALDKIWKIGYINGAFSSNTEMTEGYKKDGTTVISYNYVDLPSGTQKSAIRDGMDEWEKHANVTFIDHPQDVQFDADIRISFCTTSGSSWSAVGATKRMTDDGYVNIIPSKKPTINLGVMEGESLSELQKATILHELGHVLGMMHEHQSPARGAKITLKTEEVYKYYRPLLGFNDKLVKTQIIDEYKQGESNFSHFDPNSIMMYFMPAHLNVEQIEIRPNNRLSELDKAYIQLAYPHNDSGRLLSAMGTIGVPESDAMKIIEPISTKKDETGLTQCLDEVRQAFFNYNKRTIEAQALLKAKRKKAGVQEPLKQLNGLETRANGVESVGKSAVVEPTKPTGPPRTVH